MNSLTLKADNFSDGCPNDRIGSSSPTDENGSTWICAGQTGTVGVRILNTVLELVLYFGFVGLIAYNKPYLSQKLGAGSSMTIGIPIAVAVIALSWVLTGIYIFWANMKYDAMVKKLKEKIGG